MPSARAVCRSSCVSAAAAAASRCAAGSSSTSSAHVGEQRAGEREPLPLTARDAVPPLADVRVEAVGQARDPVRRSARGAARR